MGVRYTNQAITTERQIETLKQKGLLIDDVEQATKAFYLVYWLNSISPDNKFIKKIKKLLKQYLSVNPRMMGFHNNWEPEPLWKNKRKPRVKKFLAQETG